MRSIFMPKLELDGATIVWNGGNPKLARSEGNHIAFTVGEDNLGSLGGFFPGTFYCGAVLEDVGSASADGLDNVVIIVGIEAFVYHHDSHSGRSELLG